MSASILPTSTFPSEDWGKQFIVGGSSSQELGIVCVAAGENPSLNQFTISQGDT